MSLHRPLLFASLTLLACPRPSHGEHELDVGATTGVHVADRTEPVTGARVGWFYRHLRPDRWYSSLVGAEAELALGLGDDRAFDRTYRLHAIAQFRTAARDVRVVPFVLVGGGLVELPDERDATAYAGAGVKLRIAGGFEARLDGRWLVLPDRDAEAFVTVGYRFGRW